MAKKHRLVFSVIQHWGTYTKAGLSLNDAYLGEVKIGVTDWKRLENFAADSNGRIVVREEK